MAYLRENYILLTPSASNQPPAFDVEGWHEGVSEFDITAFWHGWVRAVGPAWKRQKAYSTLLTFLMILYLVCFYLLYDKVDIETGEQLVFYSAGVFGFLISLWLYFEFQVLRLSVNFMLKENKENWHKKKLQWFFVTRTAQPRGRYRAFIQLTKVGSIPKTESDQRWQLWRNCFRWTYKVPPPGR